MTERINQLADLINQEIEKLNLSGEPPELYQPIRYIMELGGKRLRPMLTLMSFGLFNDNQSMAIKPAIGIEMFHNFTLMHDDIMDQAPLRRGNPTVHTKWNNNVAILSGDVLLLKVYHLISQVPAEKLSEVLESFTQCAIEVCEGQQQDINFERMDSVSEGQYMQMIRQKTAVLLGFCLELGAILGGADKQSRDQLKNLGINMGLGFQLKDDLLDVYADQAKFGKQVGGDIISNKKTFLLVKAFDKARGENKEKLRQWLRKKDFDPDQKVREVTEIYDSLGIHEMTLEKVNFHFDSAFDFLDKMKIEREMKADLRDFAQWLINREN